MTKLPIRCILAAAACLLLAACLFTPGKFTSALDVRRDGSFTYGYTGEIHLLALSKLAQMGREDAAAAEFQPQPCFVKESTDERECSPAEVSQQKQEWSDGQRQAAERKRREAEQMKAMMGGLDPSDPRAAEELAARLRRQAGWRRVIYKGEGLFEVDFALSGRLDHDFAFPTVERFPQANAFVTIIRRSDGTVRIDAPGFGSAAGMEPFKAMMRGAAMGGSTPGKDMPPQLPAPDGRFTITTDAAVLANNTEEGPQADSAGQRLGWTVNLRSEAAPMALLRLSQPR